MKTLLVNPPAGLSYGVLGISRPPLGLAYIASVLKTRDHEVEIVDFNVGRWNWRRYPYDKFDVVGISVDTSRCGIAMKIARVAKRKGAIVAVGGPHVSFLDKEALASGVVDYVVRNEGEYSFLSLVEFLAKRGRFEDVKGVSYMDGGRFARTPDASPIADLDALPFPARDLLPLALYKERMNGRVMTTLVTSRGCPFNCEFCSSSQFMGVAWRARSPESIMKEVELLYETYGYRALSFVDDNFTLNPQRVSQISEMIIAKGYDLVWAAMTRVDTIVKNPGMVRTMARAGFKWTFIGFESGNQEALDGYGKKALVGDAFKAMEILRENGVEVTGAFILGAPQETKEMVKKTIDYAKRLDPRRVQFSILTPYPGTKLYEDVKDRLLTRDWAQYSGLHPTIKLDHISPGGMRGLQALAYVSFYLRPSKARENMPHIRRVIPRVSKEVVLGLVTPTVNVVSYSCLCVWKWLVGMHRLFG
ncbi:MAG: radical SAM protein [Candidatus Eisenbacteria bacterium]